MVKIISYNVNGIRAAIQKGITQWLAEQQADIICIQELKAEFDQVDTLEIEALGYSIHWHSAQKKGYSGVAIFSKLTPKNIEIGCGIEKYDFEGRVIRLDFDNFSVMSVYMPSGSSGDERQSFKMEWLADFHAYIQALRKEIPHLIISGDYNICHRAIDIHNPKGNANSSGFLPEEREWMESFVQNGFIDTFRHINPEQAHAYSWWSYRAGARGKNLGWRIDYHMASDTLKERIANAYILPDAMHSDHCPIVLELKPA
jgi:exodeoxyribonuclease-3